MNIKYLISVLITVYNRKQFIAEAIESVLQSTFTNFELIIVDDNSTDSSFKIAKTYAGNDARIRLYKNEKNLGQFQNRNKAASLAKGKYIKYLDSDDIIYPHGLEVMVNAMEQFPEASFGMPGEPNPEKLFPILYEGKVGLDRHFIDGNYFFCGPSAIIFRKDSFDAVGGFGDDPYVGSDTEILIRLANRYDYVHMQPSLIWWRIHDNQEINIGTNNFEYYLNGYKRNLALINECVERLGAGNVKLAKKKLRNLYVMQSMQLLKSGKIKPVIQLLNGS